MERIRKKQYSKRIQIKINSRKRAD
jgi:hypothetical protein